MEPEKQVQHYSELGLPMHDLPCEVSCFFIFPFPYDEKGVPEHKQKQPTRITYKTNQIKTLTVDDIRKKYRKNFPKAPKNLRFTLSKGFVLKLRNTLAEVKNFLRRDSIDGVVLYSLEGGSEEDSESEEETDYSNECGMMDFLNHESDFNAKHKSTFHFNLPNCTYVISIAISPDELVSTLQNLFFKEVYNVFGREITLDNIKDFVVRESKISLVGSKHIGAHKGLFDDCQIDVILNGKIKLSVLITEQYAVTLIKETIDIKTNKRITKSKVINYYEDKGMQISKINSKYFPGEESSSSPLCLKVMEIILRPKDRLNLLQTAVNRLKTLGKVRLVGHFVTEKMMFYRKVPQILGAGANEFSLKELEIPTNMKDIREKCEKIVSERLNTVGQGYFQDPSRIEPILIYTSQLKYIDKNTNQDEFIYAGLNQNLRNQNILDLKQEQMASDWVYRYTSTLLHHLGNIAGESGKVYRGVDYDPDALKGELITFKPFTSTSKERIVSINFSIQRYIEKEKKNKQNNNENENVKPILTLFEMDIRQGKPIANFSYFGNEAELLLEPYTEFVVDKVRDEQVVIAQTIYKFKVYTLRQIDSPRQMPLASNNYILWVDDKPHQGLETFNRFIEDFGSPTVLFQIQSTKELEKWLAERTQIIRDTSSKILMVTNMVRTEEGQRNFYAGVESINVVRKVLPNIPIVVYVRDKQASENNLNEKQVGRENLVVINMFEDFTKFLESHLNLRFISLVPKEPTIEEPPKEVEAEQKAVRSQMKKKERSCEVM